MVCSTYQEGALLWGCHAAYVCFLCVCFLCMFFPVNVPVMRGHKGA